MKNGKNSYVKLILSTAGLATLAAIVLAVCYPWPEGELEAMIAGKTLSVGTPVCFKDSSAFAVQWCWEFGNGDSLNISSGCYTYNKPGDYLIRLTVNGNPNLSRYFSVHVRTAPAQIPDDAKPALSVPDIAFTKEILFFAISEEFENVSWSFGETRKIDGTGNAVYYTYTRPGCYNIKIYASDGKILFSRTIRIMKTYDRSELAHNERIYSRGVRW